MSTVNALGVGAVYTPALHGLFERRPDLVEVLEIEPQTFWVHRDDEARPYFQDPAMLARIAALPQRKLVHGVGFPVGGARPPDPRHVGPLVDCIRALGAAWASEHLAFNRAEGAAGTFDTGFLLPPLQTDAGVEAAVRSIRSVAKQLPVPFAVETGVNYLRRYDWEMEDAAFVAAVADEADCGILLDLHNIWTNEVNGRQRAADFIAGLPLHRVREIHVAGGMMVQGYWLDAHSGSVPADVLALLREVLPQMPALGAVVFEITPTFLRSFGTDAVAREIATLREIWTPSRAVRDDPVGSPSTKIQPRNVEVVVARAPVSPAAWEDALGAAVAGAPAVGPLADDPGIQIYRMLVRNFRAGVLTEAMERTIALLVVALGKDATREVLDDFFARTRPSLFYSDEARAFAAYLRERDLDVPCLTGVAEYELATIDALVNRRANTVTLDFDPERFFAALSRGQWPGPAQGGEFRIEIVPDDAATDVIGLRDALH